MGWDGVDSRMMLVAPIANPDIHKDGVGAWLLSATGWQPMATPPQVTLAQTLNGPGAPPVSGWDWLTVAYDSDRQVGILASSTEGPSQRTAVSEWNGRSWHAVAAANAPHGVRLSAYSPELHGVVGIADPNLANTPANITWLYDGTSWRALADGDLRGSGGLLGLAYDPRRHAIIGLDGKYTSWMFDGSWKRLETVPPTPLGVGPSVAFDANRGQWIVFGGVQFAAGTARAYSDTWTSNGTAWTKLGPSTKPVERYGAPMAWDPTQHRAVLFGGLFQFCCGPFFSDTWGWDGRTWKKLLDTAPLAIDSQIPTPDPCTPTTSSGGLLIASGKLEVIDTCGKVAVSTPLTINPYMKACGNSGQQPILPPPVSATRDKIFYRDGDTQIRSLGMDGQTQNVTSVPGGDDIRSMFSVSPDDQRIAVVVEDLSSADSVNVRLYVEDLQGGSHHADIYSTTRAKQGGTTFWPIGWHDGLLALEVVPVCDAMELAKVSPSALHLADPATADRKATILPDGCTLGRWPSAAGETCTVNGRTFVMDWTGKEIRDIPIWNNGSDMQSGLSPNGARLFVSGRGQQQCSVYQGSTCVDIDVTRPYDAWTIGAGTDKWIGCLWIDNDHLLTPDAILGVVPRQSTIAPHYLSVMPIGHSGVCAGRFPGGL